MKVKCFLVRRQLVVFINYLPCFTPFFFSSLFSWVILRVITLSICLSSKFVLYHLFSLLSFFSLTFLSVDPILTSFCLPTIHLFCYCIQCFFSLFQNFLLLFTFTLSFLQCLLIIVFPIHCYIFTKFSFLIICSFFCNDQSPPLFILFTCFSSFLSCQHDIHSFCSIIEQYFYWSCHKVTLYICQSTSFHGNMSES